MSQFPLVEKPLSEAEVLRLIGEETRLTVRLAITLGALISLDIDSLNDMVDERVLPEGETRIASSLSDITYKVVGHIEEDLGAGSVILEVSGDVEVYDGDM